MNAALQFTVAPFTAHDTNGLVTGTATVGVGVTPAVVGVAVGVAVAAGNATVTPLLPLRHAVRLHAVIDITTEALLSSVVLAVAFPAADGSVTPFTVQFAFVNVPSMVALQLTTALFGALLYAVVQATVHFVGAAGVGEAVGVEVGAAVPVAVAVAVGAFVGVPTAGTPFAPPDGLGSALSGVGDAPGTTFTDALACSGSYATSSTRGRGCPPSAPPKRPSGRRCGWPRSSAPPPTSNASIL